MPGNPRQSIRAVVLGAVFLGALVVSCMPAWGQTNVTLSPATSPGAGQPGVTSMTILGSGYPSGTIPAANVTVTLQPATAGAGPSGATVATSVTTILGATRRVGFLIPATISVPAATLYLVTVAGTTSTGVAFESGNSGALTVNPTASVVSVSPNTGQPGQTISVTLTGTFTNFLNGATQVNLGAGIAVGGAPEGSFGSVTVSSPTSITAQLTIDAAAAAGPRTVQVQTGVQTASLVAGFSVAAGPSIHPPPVSNPGGPYTGAVGGAVSFNGSGSDSPEGFPLSYAWNFGDGATDTTSGANPTHAYGSTGTYTVTLVVNDGQGEINSAATSVVVSLTGNTTPPTVTITSPAPLALLNQRSVNVTGMVSDPNFAGVPVVVNGVTATVAGTAFQANSVPLREGDNVLTAVGTDGAGNVGSASLTVVVDTTPPNIQINSPANNAVLSSATVDVTGIVNDAVSGTVNAAQVTVTVNGTGASVSNRSFLVAGVPLQSGSNTIIATATDNAGNQSQAKIQVTRQASFQPQVIALSGDNQSGPIGTTLANPLVVQLLDASGNPLTVRPVTFSVVKSDGQLLGFGNTGQQVVVNTNAAGQASIPFQLGTRAGVGINQIVATYAGTTGKALFVETSTVAAPAQINLVSGTNQIGVVGDALPAPLIAIVSDSGGNPVSGANVTFSADQGGGTIGGSSTATEATDTDGKVRAVLVLGQQEGIGNNRVSANFDGGTGAPVIFTASGVVPGNPAATQVSGVVLDNAGTPVPNATVTIVGTNLSAVSNNDGNFTISGAPVGAITLLVDGRTSTRPETFPFLSFNLTAIAGQNNTVGGPVLLPPLDTTDAHTVGGSQNVVLTMAGVAGVQLTIFANSVTFPDGTHVGQMSLSQVHADKVPMQPPNGTAPLLVGTLQPPGVVFNPPVQVQYPNVTGLPPGMVVDVYSFDHDLEQFISQGPGRITADGSAIVSDPGFGITKSGWFFPDPNPQPPGCVSKPDDCMKIVNCQQVPDPSKSGLACNGINPNLQVSVFGSPNPANILIDSSCQGVCNKQGMCAPNPVLGFGMTEVAAAIQDAIAAVNNDIVPGCVGPILSATISSSLAQNGLTIYCQLQSSTADRSCGYTPSIGGNTMIFFPNAFNGTTGCTPDSSALHELVHGPGNNPGYPNLAVHNLYSQKNPPAPQDKPYGCEQSCFFVGTGTASACFSD